MNNIPIPFPIEFVTIPQSNFTKGRTMTPDVIVIHIAEGNKQSVINQFQNPSTQVSSHFLVNKDGTITQFVGTGDTAYANGGMGNPVSEIVLSRGTHNPNDYTISIEHEGSSLFDITDAQYKTTAKLVKFLHDKWNVPMDTTHVIGHRQIQSAKSCPGLISIDKILQISRTL